MIKRYKKSKFNFYCFDSEDNILLCNFLTGVNSFSMVNKADREEFEKLILHNDVILPDTKYKRAVNHLYKIGFLIDENADEDALYDAKFYETTYSKPWQLTIMPTHACNFKCKYCYESPDFMSKGKMTHESQNKILKYIQKNAARYPRLKVSWFGGEPLVAINAIKYLSENIRKICEQSKIMYESDITTNAYNLEPEVFDMLYKNKIYTYQITLDGTKAEHDKQRVKKDGSGTFDKIFTNLMYIKNNKQKYKLASIILRTNVTRSIMMNMDEFLDLYDKNFALDERFRPRFNETINYSQNTGNGLLESDYLDRNEFLDMVYSSKYGEDTASIDDIKNMFIPIYSLCYAAVKNRYVIDVDLNAYKCTVHFDLYENKVGYINNNGDMVVDEMLHKMWHVRKKPRKECMSCFYLPCCNMGACPLKYNAISNAFIQCHIQGLNEKMSINLRRLANYHPFEQVEMRY